MSKKLAINTGIYTTGNVLPKIGAVFLLPIITRYLGPAEYGIVQSMVALNSILLIIFSFGIDRSIFRLYFDYNGEDQIRKFLGTIFISLVIIGSCCLGILFLFRSYVEKIYSTIPFFPYYQYTLLAVYFGIFNIVFKSYLQIKQKANYHFLYSLANFILQYALILYLVVNRNEGAVGMLKGIMWSHLIMALIFAFNTLKVVDLKLDLSILKNSLDFSLPFIPSLLFAWILNFSDRIFIDRYLGQEEVGIYSLAYQMALVLTLLFQGLHKAYSPLFFQIASSENEIKAKSILARYNKMIIIIFAFISLVGAIFSAELIDLIFPDNFKGSGELIPLLLLGNYLLVLTGLQKLSLYQKKKSLTNMWIVVGTGVINLILNFVLIPVYGMVGAVLSTVISITFNFGLIYPLSKKEFNLPISNSFFFAVIIGLTAAYGIVGWGTTMMVSTILWQVSLKVLFSGLLLLVFYLRYRYQIHQFLNK